MGKHVRSPLGNAPALSDYRVEVSRHAAARALDMAVDGTEIRDCMQRPRKAYHEHSTGNWVYSRGRIALVVAFNGGTAVVATVLWVRDGLWRQDAEVAPMPEGRELRRRAA